MKSELAKIVSGSVLVYVGVAACSAASSIPSVEAVMDAGSAMVADALGVAVPDVHVLDALAPVRDARADGNTNESGSRLKAVVYAGEDGSREFLGWHDSKLGEDCAFGFAVDGSLRCLPKRLATTQYFEDASCTKHYVALGTSTACGAVAPHYASVTTKGNGCTGNLPKIYEVGVPVGAVDSLFKSMYPGDPCQPATAPLNTAFFFLGAEVPPSSFVAATVKTDP